MLEKLFRPSKPAAAGIGLTLRKVERKADDSAGESLIEEAEAAVDRQAEAKKRTKAEPCGCGW